MITYHLATRFTNKQYLCERKSDIQVWVARHICYVGEHCREHACQTNVFYDYTIPWSSNETALDMMLRNGGPEIAPNPR